MNYRVVSRILGSLMLLLAVVMLISEIYGYFLDEIQFSSTHDYALLQSFVFTAILGGILRWMGRGSKNEIFRKEGIAIVGLGWIFSTLVGAIPFLLCQPSLPIASAIFESASGFTTTGSTVIADLNQYPKSILLWRSTTQWLGGMGILVLFVALLSTLGVGSKALFRFESSAQIGYGFHARIRETSMRLWQIYAGITVLCIVGLMIFGMSFFDALLHSFSAVSTGGFSPKNESVTFYQSPAIEIWLTFIMLLGGTSFVLMGWLLRRNFKKFAADEELRAYLGIFLLAAVIIAIDLGARNGGNWLDNFRLSAFQVASILTTTGFASNDFDLWPTLSKSLLVLLMFVGGCAGSTSGAIKVSRLLIFLKTIRQQIVNAFRPTQIIPIRLNGAILENEIKSAAIFFIAFSVVLVGLGTVVITVFEPDLNLVSAFTAVVCTFMNIGPGLDAVGPTRNFASFHATSHLILAFLMLLGRLELFALLALFVPALWKRY